jgi:hypothetical protein
VSDDFPVEAPRTNNEELDPTLRGYFRVPGAQTLIRLTGFMKADLFYDPSFTGLWYGGLAPSSFPSSPQPNSLDSTVSIRPSRFTAEFRHSPWGTTFSRDLSTGIFTARRGEILFDSDPTGASTRISLEGRPGAHLEIPMPFRIPSICGTARNDGAPHTSLPVHASAEFA